MESSSNVASSRPATQAAKPKDDDGWETVPKKGKGAAEGWSQASLANRAVEMLMLQLFESIEVMEMHPNKVYMYMVSVEYVNGFDDFYVTSTSSETG